MHFSDFIIAGAGISGLTAALKLRQAGYKVSVVEASGEVGGALKTFHKDGWILEAGPNTVLATHQSFERLVESAGMKSDLVEASPAAQNRYILRDSVPYALPTSPLRFAYTPLFGWKTKLGLLREPFIKPGTDPDETLADFVVRRLGREFLDYAINPFVAGVYAGDPNRLSVRHAFPKLWQLEQNHGSLIKGSLRKPPPGRDPDDIPRSKAKMITFRNGNQSLAEAIGDTIGPGNIFTGRIIQSVGKENGDFRVETGNGDVFRAKKLIFTLPQHTFDDIDFQIPGFSNFEKTAQQMTHPPVSVMHLGYLKNQIKHPLDGFGMLVPEAEDRNILGVLFNSSIFPERTPDPDHALLTVFTGGMRNPEIAGLDEPELLEAACRDLEEIFEISGEPVMTQITRWPRAIPQYEPGYELFLGGLERLEADNPGLYFIGNYRGGISVADCIKNAEKLTQSLIVS